MPLTLSGYVLEPPRVGQANSPFTSTPNVYISNQGQYDTAYPSNESAPRSEYHVFVLEDGDLPDARFCWTKNEELARFGYDGRDQRFKTLPGGPPTLVGVVSAAANTERLTVAAPALSNFSTYPVRLFVGPGSGTTLTISLVPDEASFTTPSPGTVQVAQDTGTLHWATADLSTYAGLDVRFQQQTFFAYADSNGRLGLVSESLFLNPLPATGQFPLLRIGYSAYVTPVEVATEAGFSANPASGTIEWARNTGRLKLNTSDVSSNPGKNVYYDGVVFEFGGTVTTGSLGTVSSPGNIVLPPEESDLFFRVTGVVQFPTTTFVDTLDSIGKRGVVQVRRSDGQVQFSLPDQVLYGSQSVEYVVPDYPVDHGLSLRLFRTPIDPAAQDSDLKDVTALYEQEGSRLASPIIAAPTVLLPAVPRESESIVARIVKLRSTVVLPRLDVSSPPPGLGYALDLDQRQFLFANRKEDVVLPSPTPFGVKPLADPLVLASNFVFEMETAPSSGVYTALTLGEDFLFDYAAGLATFVSTEGSLISEGAAGAFSSTTFTDTNQNFTTAGAVAGDLLVVLSGSAKGVYTLAAVGTTTVTTDIPGVTSSNLSYEIRRGREVVADRFFQDIPPTDPNTRVERLQSLGTISNSPRLNIDVTYVSATRFRFASGSFSTSVVTVANNLAFTTPSLLAAGTVQVSLATGDLNFSQANVAAGGSVFWAKALTLGTDYLLQPALGFIDFTSRFLENEEVFVTYRNSDGVTVEERGSFLVRKELGDHPTPTNVVTFNPLDREVSSQPFPRVYRGGRPQDSTQVSIDVASASVTFLPSSQVTDALPSGSVVSPDENVYIDYNVFGAIGGEKSLTVLQFPMFTVPVTISSGTNSFTIMGDRTADFPANHLLLVDSTELYLLAAPTYSIGTGLTTVALASTQIFRSDFNNPGLAISSGETRVSSFALYPSYFQTELSAYEAIPRGGSKVRITGDVSRSYGPGTVVLFTDGGGSFLNFSLVTGSTYDVETGKTEVTLASNGMRQYTPGVHILRRSVRPVFSSSSVATATSRSPELTEPLLIYRRVEGQIGEILYRQLDGEIVDDSSTVTIDAAGRVVLSDNLLPGEELVILYTGDEIIQAGRRVRASYTHAIAPSASNGLLGNVLTLDYTTYAPDSFYWRVEPLSSFQAELAEQYETDAQASVPSGGPILENSTQPSLADQGRESAFYQEGRLTNEDIVARANLKYFHDAVEYIEDCLQNLDGRVVGDRDGRFKFDGLIDNPVRASYDDATNHIDDILKVSDAPFEVSFPPFAVTPLGTYQELYKPSQFSRFYPTRRSRYGVTADPTGLETGDAIMDIGAKNIRSADNPSRRSPWAVVTQASVVGATVVSVDDANGAEELLRPAFLNNVKVYVQAQDGTVLIPANTPVTIQSTTATSITFTAPLAVDIPVGATIRLSPIDTVYFKVYRAYLDVGVDEENGTLTHIEAFPPLDGSVGGIPSELLIQNPAGGEILDVRVTLNNSLTEPDRIPALDGGTTDDDRDRQLPILSPSLESEMGDLIGYAVRERDVVEVGGTLRSATTAPFVGVGSLDVTRTILTNTGGAWPSPVPKVGDLVEIRSGLNANSGFRRIGAVGGSTITLVSPQTFPLQDAGFTFTVTVSNSLVTKVATGTISPATRLTDGTADFITANVQPGHTVVVTAGGLTGLRRQVTAVVSATQLDVTSFGSTAGLVSYRVDNPLGTFGGVNSLVDDELIPVLDGQLEVLDTNSPPTDPWSQRVSLERFLDHVLVDVTTGTSGLGVFATFSDVTANFQTANVQPGHFVYIPSGVNDGFYEVVSVNSPTSLTVQPGLPIPAGGLSYRITTALGLSQGSLQGVYSTLQEVVSTITGVTNFRDLITTAVAVTGDASAYARRTLTSDLDSRVVGIDFRATYIDDVFGAKAQLEAILSSGDRLYDRRYTWIDARINIEKGILPKRDRARENRLKAERDIVKQLTKLLTVRG